VVSGLVALEARAEQLVVGGAAGPPTSVSVVEEIARVEEALCALPKSVSELRVLAEERRRDASSLQRIGSAVESIARGRFDTRVDVEGGTSVVLLGEAVSRLAESLQRQVVRIRAHAAVLSSQGGAGPDPNGLRMLLADLDAFAIDRSYATLFPALVGLSDQEARERVHALTGLAASSPRTPPIA
jgi:hypothetical protein